MPLPILLRSLGQWQAQDFEVGWLGIQNMNGFKKMTT
jgi:hypothetical protein